jgi:PIN domain nuclease of toxin-antitoxin system
MNLLLDSHALLWCLFEPAALGKRAAAAIRSPENNIHVSTVTLWELSLKYALGKLELHGVTPAEIPALAVASGFDLLPLAEGEAASFHNLPRLAHKDPFDRMLIWQAISRKLTLVSCDKAFAVYREQGLRVIW